MCIRDRPGAVYELYTVDDIYSADGTKLLDAGTKLATSSTTNASGFTWFDVDVPIRGEYYIDPAGCLLYTSRCV